MPAPDLFDYESALEACASGDRSALKSLYEREARTLLGVAQKILRDRDMAHDVLQEGFLQVWQRASTYQRALGSGRGWLYTVVRHRALDEARKVKREIFLGDAFDVLTDSLVNGSTLDDRTSRDAESLQRCLDGLDPRRRACILGAFVEGYTHEQIAVQFATPVGTIKSWIRRGLLSLRECLS
ncbi:MAG: sigma-70 family RNA polymerase sigma factor [Variovorax sp.]|nr:MAG: sigma-70 family RNA polymerase sigma factor [Variovorax sp.]